MTRAIKNFGIVLAITAIGFFGNSCNHDKTCTATIKLVAADGTTPVGDAKVELYATISTPTGPVIGDLKAEDVTGSDGTVTFKFQLPAILDIKGSKNALTGQGIIKLEEKKTVSKTVIIQ